jgi:hypothetical protein
MKYPKTLLMKCYGFFKWKGITGSSYFVMFNNFLKSDLSIDEKYDLKVVPTECPAFRQNRVLQKTEKPQLLNELKAVQCF